MRMIGKQLPKYGDMPSLCLVGNEPSGFLMPVSQIITGNCDHVTGLIADRCISPLRSFRYPLVSVFVEYMAVWIDGH